MEETFGEAFTNLPKSKIGHGSKFMKDWEGVKAAFTGAVTNKQYYVPLPALGQALGATGDHGVASTAYDFMDNAVVLSG